MPEIRVVVADDHALVREGVRALLDGCPDIAVVGEAADGLQAIEQCRLRQPDVLLLDVAMPGLGGLEAALAVRRECPRTRIVVLSQYDDREYVTRFLKLGVAGYVLKKTVGRDLASAVRAAHRGGVVLDPEVARAALDDRGRPAAQESPDPYDTLTDREKQVLKLVAEGRSNKEVAQDLGISVKTAMSHREHVMAKLDVHNRTELVRFALQRGVIV
ncbi:MAG TPA: response regulator transcription factor [Vicinamibacteria bacterium]|jgi:DNA-binding NarL/FixJ family response regulator